jgi:hypothetical protein
VPLKNRPFLELVREAAFASLEGEKPTAQVRGSMLQVYFGEFPQHYEVWLRGQVGLVELGLHFESEREESYRRLAVVAEAMPEIAARLGPAVDVEEWTERWARVHETVPLKTLDETFARHLGERLAEFIRVLEPVVAPLGPIAPVQRRPAGERFRGRRRARAVRS